MPYPAVSVWALILLLERWAFARPRAGGVTDVDAQLASSWFLEKVLMSLTDAAPFDILIDFVRDWRNPWPIPYVRTGPVSSVRALANGNVDCSAWSHAADVAPGGTISSCWDRFQILWTGEGRKTLPIFLSVLASVPKLLSVYRQVVWHLGNRLQKQYMDSVQSGTPGEHYSLDPVAISDNFGNRWRCDHLVWRYVQACRPHALNQQYWSCATDGAAVGRCQLTSTVWVLPSNVAFIAPPQVVLLWGCSALPGRGSIRRLGLQNKAAPTESPERLDSVAGAFGFCSGRLLFVFYLSKVTSPENLRRLFVQQKVASVKVCSLFGDATFKIVIW